MIRPELCTSEHFVEVSCQARLTFVLLQMFCDDAGIHPASPAKVKMRCYPADAFSRDEVAAWCDELVSGGLLRLYEVAGDAYWQVVGWHHQIIRKPSFVYPAPAGNGAVPVPHGYGTGAAPVPHPYSTGTSRPTYEGKEGRKGRKETRASARDGAPSRASAKKKISTVERVRQANGMDDGE